ncbi:hypothetical protein Sjap_023778 [Stephania japonica]|uniref:Uncharacterized protein n=1 Tax=Stephania japonica TaxID=461633 RepID=A0AAP0HNA7_9MAGN
MPISLQSWFNDDPVALQMHVVYLSMVPIPPTVGNVTTRHTMPDFVPIVSSGGSVHPTSSSRQGPHDTFPSPRYSTEHASHSSRHLGQDTTPPSNHSAKYRHPLCSDHPVEYGSHSPSSSVPRSTLSISTAGHTRRWGRLCGHRFTGARGATEDGSICKKRVHLTITKKTKS